MWRPSAAEAEAWKDRFLMGAENSPRSKPRNAEALKEEEIIRLKRKIGGRFEFLTHQRIPFGFTVTENAEPVRNCLSVEGAAETDTRESVSRV